MRISDWSSDVCSSDLDRQLKQMVRGWLPAVEEALAESEEAGRAATLAQRYAPGFPMGYRNGAGPAEAAIDIRLLHSLSAPGDKSKIGRASCRARGDTYR